MTVLPGDAIERAAYERRKAHAGEVKRLGGKPVVIKVVGGNAEIEVASRAEHGTLVAVRLTTSPTPAPSTTPAG